MATADAVNTAGLTTVLSFQVAANEMGDGDYLRIQWVAEAAANQQLGGKRTIKFVWGAASITLLTATSIQYQEERRLRFTLDAWRQGATLWLAPDSSKGHDDPLGDLVLSLTPPFTAAHTVALTVQHTKTSPEVYYRVKAAHAMRWAAP